MEGSEGSMSVFYVHHDANGIKIAEKVMAVTGIPVEKQLLYCHDKPIHLHETIEEQKIGDGDRINVCLKICGGSGEKDKVS